MPFNWFSKPQTRKSFWLFRAAGPSWSASPLRRCVQAAFFALFLFLFFYAAWPFGSDEKAGQKWVDLFLKLDPLVSITAAIAGREWVASLGIAAAILTVSLILPRAFCGYLCPMGTAIDLFDRAIGKRRFAVKRQTWWRSLRYYVLAGVLAAAIGGVILTGYVAAIPLITRGMQFLGSPVQVGLARGWDQVPPISGGQILSVGLFAGILLLGFLRPRFWCCYLCPTGAVFSLANLLRLTERKVEPHCIRCGKCSRVCSFDAINDDFTTTGTNCAFCQTCGGVCPVDAIRFTHRRSAALPASSVLTPPRTLVPAPVREQTSLSRRGFLIGTALGTAGGGLAVAGVRLGATGKQMPLLRPPGSAAEENFLSLCVRCGECLRVCPSGILQPAGLGQGLERLWTPWANADWSGCQASCNRCGQVCPTGAIRALSLESKRQARMGLAHIDTISCLAGRAGAGEGGRGECETAGGLLCEDACEYSAIVSQGQPHLIPTILADACVGCGACQAACFRANVSSKHLLGHAAVRIRPGQVRPVSSGSATTTTIIDVPYYVPAD